MRGLDFILEHHRGELGDSLQYSTLLYKVWRGSSSSLTLLLLLRMTYTMLSGTERKERAVPDQSSQSSTIHVLAGRACGKYLVLESMSVCTYTSHAHTAVHEVPLPVCEVL